MEVTDSTLVLRPARSTMFLWLFVFVVGLSWMFWKFTLYDASPRALWFLLFPGMALAGVVIELLHPHLSVTTLDRERDLILFERRALPGLRWKSRRFALSEFAGVVSFSTWYRQTPMWNVVLVTMDLRSLALASEPGGYAGTSFLSELRPTESPDARKLREAIVRATGLKDFGFRESVPPYRSIDQ